MNTSHRCIPSSPPISLIFLPSCHSPLVAQATNSEVHSLFKAVDDRMRKHLKECVGDAFRVAVAPPSLAPPSFSPLEGSRSDRSLPPKAAPVARFMEGQRVRATDGLCGRVCFDPAARGFYRLQLADGTVYQGKRYRGSELTPSTFDPATEMPSGFEVAPLILGGCEVQVYWLEDDGCGGHWEAARFAQTVGGGGPGCDEVASRGWFTLLYEDADLDPEQIFIALPQDAGAHDDASSFFAARVDGEQLWPGRDIRINHADLARAVQRMRMEQEQRASGGAEAEVTHVETVLADEAADGAFGSGIDEIEGIVVRESDGPVPALPKVRILMSGGGPGTEARSQDTSALEAGNLASKPPFTALASLVDTTTAARSEPVATASEASTDPKTLSTDVIALLEQFIADNGLSVADVIQATTALAARG